MEVSDSRAFGEQLVIVAEVFDVKLSPARQAVYFDVLRDLPLAGAIQALRLAMRTLKWFPKPAELRTLALGDPEDRAELAWVGFKQAMRSAGAYRTLAVADPVLGEAIVAVFGSWPAACATDLSPEMWSSKRKEFGRVYRALTARGLTGVRCLPGICEQQNAGVLAWRGYVPVAVLEGDTIRQLDGDAAEIYRAQIAAETGARGQLTSSTREGLTALVRAETGR